MKHPPVVKMLCTLPADVHQWLQEQAVPSLAPTSSVIVAICRKAMTDAERPGRRHRSTEMPKQVALPPTLPPHLIAREATGGAS
jgi:hypothetical protein